MAQTAPPPTVTIKKALPAKPPEPPATPASTDAPDVASVVVSAERPTNRIDRQVYDVKSDVGASNGSAADALNSVPSVAVDPDGSVTLRGSPNVQILIDGKPSAMLQGENRGASLNAIPAEDIESVEVINNPGAQFGNDGGGGPIINLVMRRTRRPGGFGVVNANGGTAGRYNTGLSGTYNSGVFGIQGGLNVRHDGRASRSETVRDRIDPTTGAMVHSAQAGGSSGLNDNVGANASLNYNIGAKDTLAASLSYQGRDNAQRSQDRYLRHAADGAGAGPGPVDSDYVRSTQRGGDSRNYGLGARWEHKGGVDGESMKVDLRVSSADNTHNSAYKNIYAVAPRGALDQTSFQDNASNNRIIDFTGDYELPIDRAMLKLGYKVASNRSEFDTLYTGVDPVSQLPYVNTQRSNRFSMAEKNLALYGSYQVRLNEKWGVLGGLRVEHTGLDIEQLTTHVNAANNYLSYIPSAYATYKWSDDTTLRFSYAHRLRRPTANELNPFVIYRDELNVSSGNPQLNPTKTDSFELGYESRVAGMETSLRAYHRKDRDSILIRRYFINDTVLLTTPANGGRNNASGLEFTLQGKIMPGLSMSASGNLGHTEQLTEDLYGFISTRTASSLSGRLRLNYQVTPDDQFQTMLTTQGRALSGQGVRQPNTTVNFSLRHALTPKLNLVLNLTDAFNSNQIETLTDTATLKENSIRRSDGRIAYLGLSYRLGGFTAGTAGTGNRPGGGQGQGMGQGQRGSSGGQR
ncbi:TonB-dependent receptor [Massilia sp. Root351]|uniref:TonB-dependent receptor domain-containing protein n=1 Tax=Massilia sp. Root351 TaxID=1736522 RepID=UPI00070A55FD|nr:TonB-dependent receptor [Massilia sp. Root351]KQV82445.1 TonB-dependent receptor [Massilia sp. Root351]